ncbi:MAG: 50S ribosomal protein L4 [Candidatus Nanohaloarchaea archaeon]
MSEMPDQFNERVRPDIVKRAALSIKSKNRQSYGAEGDAGLKHVTRWRQRRRSYRSKKGKGRARTPRKIQVARGMQLFGDGAEAPNTRGGRRAHPPKAEKDFSEEINDKERRKAIRSAIAASNDAKLVEEHHNYDGELPLIEEGLESVEKTSELKERLEDIGLEEELERCSEKKVRAGRGKTRGRKYRRKKGPLVVVAEDEGLLQASNNLAGVEVSLVDQLNAEKLSMGARPGRLVVWSEKALEELNEKELYR